MYKFLFALVVLSACVSAVTQTSSAPLLKKADALVSNYADEATVVERDDVVYQFAADGTGSRLETSVFRVQSSAALQGLAVLSFPYASGMQRLDIVYLRVRKPDGGIVETPVTDAQNQPAPATQIAPMYSDLHLKQIPVRSLAVGDKLEFQIRTTHLQADVPGEFWGQENFGAGVVFLERTIELRVPKQKLLTVYSPDHKPEISDAGSERVYRWKGAQLRATNTKEDDIAPPIDTKPPIAWTTFQNWEAVGLWYRGVIAGRDAVTPAVQAKADELTATAKTDTDKVRALYQYVSAHNHYVGIDFGIGRYQPHAAGEVMTNQYGDCKDKHTLLAALLRAKGFQVSAALIGLGIDMNEKVPMPGAFNHLITLVDVGNEKVWLDATTEVAPYGALLAMLRDKEALVVPAAGAPGLRKTPAELPYAAVTRTEVKSELDKTGSLKGHVEVSLRGDDEVLMRMASRQVARAQWDQMSGNYQNASGYTAVTSGTVLDSSEDTAKPWEMRYDIAITPYGEWATFRIGSLLPNNDLPAIDEKKPPKKDINLGNPHVQSAISTIHLPKGYSADLPDAIHLKSPFATFDETYRMSDGDLVSEFKLQTLLAKVPSSDWKDYKKFLDDIGASPWIQLTSKERIAGEKEPPLAGENNPVAAELVRQVHDAIVANNFDLAHTKSEQTIVVNDRQSYAWSQKGFLAARRGDTLEAATDYERELKQHPENTDQYAGLIFAERQAGRKTQERDALIAYARAEPKKDTVVLFAGGLLALDHINDAVEVYRSGAKAFPENKIIQVELGSALLRSGKLEEAISIVKAALNGSADPYVLNAGAYVLVSNNADLPLAESSCRKAVDLLEAESAATALESVNDHTFRRVNLLLASWDTLGWIYFAEGKSDLAEQYVHAAWASSSQAEEGLHLGNILEKRGESVKAMQAYEMALSGNRGNSATPVLNGLETRVSALKKQGVRLQYPHADTVLQERRTFRIPRSADLKGSAIFLAQVSALGTQKVQFLSGDEAFRGLGGLLKPIDLGLGIPKGSHALLLRSGVLFCSTQATCEFVLTPPATANAK